MVTGRFRALRAEAQEQRRLLIASLDQFQRFEAGLVAAQQAHISEDVTELVALRAENRRLRRFFLA